MANFRRVAHDFLAKTQSKSDYNNRNTALAALGWLNKDEQSRVVTYRSRRLDKAMLARQALKALIDN